MAINSQYKPDSTISVVHSGALSAETAQTSGSLRLSAVSATHSIVSFMSWHLCSGALGQDRHSSSRRAGYRGVCAAR